MTAHKDWRSTSVKIWHYLVKNRHRFPLYFHHVAHDVGVDTRHLNSPLSYIMVFCERHQLPPLTSIIMNKHDHTRRYRLRPSAHFRLKHQGKLYFPDDDRFDTLYQQCLANVKSKDWSLVDYVPSSLSYTKLRQHLIAEKEDDRSPHARPSKTLMSLARKTHFPSR